MEHGRVSTSLELFFDLTFAILFGVAAAQFTGAGAQDQVAAGLLVFVFSSNIEGEHVDNRRMVLGYVIMRAAVFSCR